jgi:hypothetical protein
MNPLEFALQRNGTQPRAVSMDLLRKWQSCSADGPSVIAAAQDLFSGKKPQSGAPRYGFSMGSSIGLMTNTTTLSHLLLHRFTEFEPL